MSWHIYTGVSSPFGRGYRRDFTIADRCKCGVQLGGGIINSGKIPWVCGGCKTPVALYLSSQDANAGYDICNNGTTYLQPIDPAYLAVFRKPLAAGYGSVPLTPAQPVAIIEPVAPSTTPSPPAAIDWFAINKEFSQ